MKRDATIVEAATVEEAFHYLMTSSFDLMIADLTLANGSCLSLLQHLGSFQFKLPVILLSSEEADNQICARVAASLIESRVSERKIVQLIAGLAGRPQRSEAA
jgi:DNA-binding NarL/FixJ family response regulator